MPHLVTAWNIYKDQQICTFHHMHTTNTCITGDGRMRRNKMTNQYAEEKRGVFSNLFFVFYFFIVCLYFDVAILCLRKISKVLAWWEVLLNCSC